MDVSSFSGSIIGVCSGLALLTPLIKALSQWHVALRKTNKPAAAPATGERPAGITDVTGSRWSRMSGFERVAAISNLVTFTFCGVVLLLLLFTAPSTPASSRDVVLVGLLVWLLIVTSRPINT